MSQNLILGFPIPVALAALLALLVLLVLARILVPMRKPVPVRMPTSARREQPEGWHADGQTVFRLGHLEIAPLGERSLHHDQRR
jgi:hypothetical protein